MPNHAVAAFFLPLIILGFAIVTLTAMAVTFTKVVSKLSLFDVDPKSDRFYQAIKILRTV